MSFAMAGLDWLRMTQWDARRDVPVDAQAAIYAAYRESEHVALIFRRTAVVCAIVLMIRPWVRASRGVRLPCSLVWTVVGLWQRECVICRLGMAAFVSHGGFTVLVRGVRDIWTDLRTHGRSLVRAHGRYPILLVLAVLIETDDAARALNSLTAGVAVLTTLVAVLRFCSAYLFSGGSAWAEPTRRGFGRALRSWYWLWLSGWTIDIHSRPRIALLLVVAQLSMLPHYASLLTSHFPDMVRGTLLIWLLLHGGLSILVCMLHGLMFAVGPVLVDSELRRSMVGSWSIFPQVLLMSHEIYPYPRTVATSHTAPEDVCPICLSDYSEGDVLRALSSCRHQFHHACSTTWLVHHPTCPCCRAPVLDFDAFRDLSTWSATQFA
jgi:Ring finger domain